MKLLKYIVPIFVVFAFLSCSDDDDTLDPINEVEDLLLVQEIINDSHIVELYTESGILSQGYNNITLRIKDKGSNNYIQNASISWKPMMHMTSMMHACPKSEIIKVSGMESIYNGYIVFQMPGNLSEGWDLTINYSIDQIDYSVVGDINVIMTDKKVVSVFTGTDNVKYILALIDPNNPEVAMNDITVGLYKMESMMSFPVVSNFMLKLDPRMTSMGNHTSPNNEDLIYNNSTSLYNGKLSLTMSGYWKLNFMLYNSNNE